MTKQELYKQIIEKKSFICVGLDTDIQKIPRHLLKADDPVFEFNKQIIDATQDLCVAYKLNIAFYESLGAKGWESITKTINHIPKNSFTIADAKRGDIGNTSELYARTFFEQFPFDAITVAPYMGHDSIIPFTNYAGKWVILVTLTSNAGAKDFQLQKMEKNGKMFFEEVLSASKEWGNEDNMMYVVGATRADLLEKIRKTVPHHFLLVPGVGAQGGDLKEVAKFGMNKQCGLLVNASRSIIYAGKDNDFAAQSRLEAKKIQSEMEELLKMNYNQ